MSACVGKCLSSEAALPHRARGIRGVSLGSVNSHKNSRTLSVAQVRSNGKVMEFLGQALKDCCKRLRRHWATAQHLEGPSGRHQWHFGWL